MFLRVGDVSSTFLQRIWCAGKKLFADGILMFKNIQYQYFNLNCYWREFCCRSLKARFTTDKSVSRCCSPRSRSLYSCSRWWYSIWGFGWTQDVHVCQEADHWAECAKWLCITEKNRKQQWCNIPGHVRWGLKHHHHIHFMLIMYSRL